MKPILQRESSPPDPASVFKVSKSHLPPIPDTWGSMNAQPTQPEEVPHLLEFSPVIQRTSTSEETVKSRRKFAEVFRKRSTATAVLDTRSSEVSRMSESIEDALIKSMVERAKASGRNVQINICLVYINEKSVVINFFSRPV